VLDEADKMVEMGFIEDVERILEYTPDGRQILLFGATLSNEIDHLKHRFMKDPAVAEAEKQVKEDLLEQYYYNVEPHDKFSLLVHLLKKEDAGKAIIFCSARSTVEILTKNLRGQKIKADMIHGKLSQNRRLNVIEGFAKGKCDILVASAVAARGIDIKDVTHIFNYDLSRDPQEYIHRVGRTARAGESGKAITLLCHRDYEVFDALLGRYDVNISELPKENFQKLRFDARSSGRGRPRFGGRGFGRGQRNGQRRGWNDRNDRPKNWEKKSTSYHDGGGRQMWKVEKVNTSA
jgi:ATP-dependent RNA helicase DeaD